MTMDNIDRIMITAQIATMDEWDKWREKIPYMSFPSSWLVKAIPPFDGAIVRYNIQHKHRPKSFVSVYLDCYDRLGYFGQPYWEIYPAKGGDTARFAMANVEDMVREIGKALRSQK